MDERLVGFAKRLARATREPYLDESALPYWQALHLVRQSFLREMDGTVLKNEVMKCYPNLVQLHWPAKDSGDMQKPGFDWYPEEWHTLAHERAELGEWLILHAEEIAAKFVEEAKRCKLTVTYRLELPLGFRGTLWNAPFHLVWVYDTYNDCDIARFDLLGM